MQKFVVAAALAGLFVPVSAVAAPDVALGARVSTLGLGAEVTVGVMERLNVRVPFNFINYSDDLEEDGIDYEADLKWRTFGVLLDYHPFKGGFHLTGGLLSNGNQVDMLGTSANNSVFEIGDRNYTADPNDPLHLTGKLDFNSVAPYVGVGWGNPILGNRNLYFKFELGVMFQGSPKVELRGDGSAQDIQSGQTFTVGDGSAASNTFLQEIENERASLEDDIKDFEFWPVIGLSLGWRF